MTGNKQRKSKYKIMREQIRIYTIDYNWKVKGTGWDAIGNYTK